MIVPADLLATAEDVARRIPNDPAYVGERNTCWLAIGQEHLRLDHFGDTLDALRLLTDREAQAELRVAAAHWSGAHPESEPARDLVRETVDDIALWEESISRKDMADLVKPIFTVLGGTRFR